VISPSQRPLPTQDNTTYIHKRQKSMLSAGYEPVIPVTKRPKTYALDQGWANYGPRAKYGPLRGSMRPAEGLENAKKNEVSKNI
jgi:hypothetical protein